MHEILFPSPFGTPPSPELVARARLVPVPEGFTGRAGVLVFEDEAGMHAEHAFEPVSRALCGAGGEGHDWSTLRAAALWPGMSRDEVPERTLVDGRGVRFTVMALSSSLFERESMVMLNTRCVLTSSTSTWMSLLRRKACVFRSA